MTGIICEQFSYAWELSTRKDKEKGSYWPIQTFWQPLKSATKVLLPLIVLMPYMNLQLAVQALYKNQGKGMARNCLKTEDETLKGAWKETTGKIKKETIEFRELKWTWHFYNITIQTSAEPG